jgi:hypothetical protein
MMDDLRDVSIHPDGRRSAFNAGMKRVEHWVVEHWVVEHWVVEHWVMENVLPK